MQPTSLSEFSFPVRTISGTAGHRAEQIRIDLDDFLDGLRGCGLKPGVEGKGTDVGSTSGSGIDRDDHAVLEFEGEGRCAVDDVEARRLVFHKRDRLENQGILRHLMDYISNGGDFKRRKRQFSRHWLYYVSSCKDCVAWEVSARDYSSNLYRLKI
jgi:hypothetical protein